MTIYEFIYTYYAKQIPDSFNKPKQLKNIRIQYVRKFEKEGRHFFVLVKYSHFGQEQPNKHILKVRQRKPFFFTAPNNKKIRRSETQAPQKNK